MIIVKQLPLQRRDISISGPGLRPIVRRIARHNRLYDDIRERYRQRLDEEYEPASLTFRDERQRGADDLLAGVYTLNIMNRFVTRVSFSALHQAIFDKLVEAFRVYSEAVHVHLPRERDLLDRCFKQIVERERLVELAYSLEHIANHERSLAAAPSEPPLPGPNAANVAFRQEFTAYDVERLVSLIATDPELHQIAVSPSIAAELRRFFSQEAGSESSTSASIEHTEAPHAGSAFSVADSTVDEGAALLYTQLVEIAAAHLAPSYPGDAPANETVDKAHRALDAALIEAVGDVVRAADASIATPHEHESAEDSDLAPYEIARLIFAQTDGELLESLRHDIALRAAEVHGEHDGPLKGTPAQHDFPSSASQPLDEVARNDQPLHHDEAMLSTPELRDRLIELMEDMTAAERADIYEQGILPGADVRTITESLEAINDERALRDLGLRIIEIRKHDYLSALVDLYRTEVSSLESTLFAASDSFFEFLQQELAHDDTFAQALASVVGSLTADTPGESESMRELPAIMSDANARRRGIEGYVESLAVMLQGGLDSKLEHLVRSEATSVFVTHLHEAIDRVAARDHLPLEAPLTAQALPFLDILREAQIGFDQMAQQMGGTIDQQDPTSETMQHAGLEPGPDLDAVTLRYISTNLDVMQERGLPHPGPSDDRSRDVHKTTHIEDALSQLAEDASYVRAIRAYAHSLDNPEEERDILSLVELVFAPSDGTDPQTRRATAERLLQVLTRHLGERMQAESTNPDAESTLLPIDRLRSVLTSLPSSQQGDDLVQALDRERASIERLARIAGIQTHDDASPASITPRHIREHGGEPYGLNGDDAPSHLRERIVGLIFALEPDDLDRIARAEGLYDAGADALVEHVRTMSDVTELRALATRIVQTRADDLERMEMQLYRVQADALERTLFEAHAQQADDVLAALVSDADYHHAAQRVARALDDAIDADTRASGAKLAFDDAQTPDSPDLRRNTELLLSRLIELLHTYESSARSLVRTGSVATLISCMRAALSSSSEGSTSNSAHVADPVSTISADLTELVLREQRDIALLAQAASTTNVVGSSSSLPASPSPDDMSLDPAQLVDTDKTTRLQELVLEAIEALEPAALDRLVSEGTLPAAADRTMLEHRVRNTSEPGQLRGLASRIVWAHASENRIGATPQDDNLLALVSRLEGVLPHGDAPGAAASTIEPDPLDSISQVAGAMEPAPLTDATDQLDNRGQQQEEPFLGHLSPNQPLLIDLDLSQRSADANPFVRERAATRLIERLSHALASTGHADSLQRAVDRAVVALDRSVRQRLVFVLDEAFSAPSTARSAKPSSPVSQEDAPRAAESLLELGVSDDVRSLLAEMHRTAPIQHPESSDAPLTPYGPAADAQTRPAYRSIRQTQHEQAAPYQGIATTPDDLVLADAGPHASAEAPGSPLAHSIQDVERRLTALSQTASSSERTSRELKEQLAKTVTDLRSSLQQQGTQISELRRQSDEIAARTSREVVTGYVFKEFERKAVIERMRRGR